MMVPGNDTLGGQTPEGNQKFPGKGNDHPLAAMTVPGPFHEPLGQFAPGLRIQRQAIRMECQ